MDIVMGRLDGSIGSLNWKRIGQILPTTEHVGTLSNSRST